MEPMKEKEINTCNKAMDNVFSQLGIPETIYSDEGSEFTNNAFVQLLEKYKIEMHTCNLNRYKKCEIICKYYSVYARNMQFFLHLLYCVD